MRSNHKLSANRVTGISFLVSISDVVLNLLVALATGSVVMISQSLQGLADLITAGVLYFGVRRSQQHPDQHHQFGHGREILFWVLVAGMFMFLGTGGLSLYLGYERFIEPAVLSNEFLAFGMLSFGLVTNFYAFSKSVQRLNQTEGKAHWWYRFLRSGMVETKATFIIDFMGTIAALFGLGALSIYLVTGNGQFDGVGAMVIGISTMLAAGFLIRDVKSLIVGRSVPDEIAAKIRRETLAVSDVQEVLDLRTMYVGSARYLVILEVHLRDGLKTDRIEAIMDQIKHCVSENIPSAYHVQVEVETPDREL